MAIATDSDTEHSAYQTESSLSSDDDSEDSAYEECSDGKVFIQMNTDLQFCKFDTGEPVNPYLDENPLERPKKQTKGRIGYRVTDDDSAGRNTADGIWAGAYNQGYTPPTSRNDPTFIRGVIQHLRREKIASPLISIWASPISAIHKLVNSETAVATIIDLDYLGRDTSEFPLVNHAKELIWQYRIRLLGFPDGRLYNYRGDPELLVWQHIEKHAIISTISVAEFNLLLAQVPDLNTIFAVNKLRQSVSVSQFKGLSRQKVARNYRVGFAIGRLFSRVEIPPRFVVKTANDFAKSFDFESEIKSVPETHTDEYLNGVWTGFNYRQAPAGQTSTPKSIMKQSLFDINAGTPAKRSQQRKAASAAYKPRVSRKACIVSSDDDEPLLQLMYRKRQAQAAKNYAPAPTPNETFLKRKAKSVLFRSLSRHKEQNLEQEQEQPRQEQQSRVLEYIRGCTYRPRHTPAFAEPLRATSAHEADQRPLQIQQSEQVGVESEFDSLSLLSLRGSSCGDGGPSVSSSLHPSSHGHDHRPIASSPPIIYKDLERASIKCETDAADISEVDTILGDYAESITNLSDGIVSDIVPDEELACGAMVASNSRQNAGLEIDRTANEPLVDEFMDRRRRIDAYLLNAMSACTEGRWVPWQGI